LKLASVPTKFLSPIKLLTNYHISLKVWLIIINNINFISMIEFDFKKWNRGVLYRVYLVQRGSKNLWDDYDYSNEWKRLEEVMEKDLHDDEVFLFHHPKYSKKEYQRKYHLCPANGNARMVVGRMRNPLDFAYVSFVLHSYFYKVPYIVIEDYSKERSSTKHSKAWPSGGILK
jgi:hypothetical protein